MAKARVHVTHHFTVSHTHFYELEIDLPDGLSESEAQRAVADAKHEILGMLRDGDQYDSTTNKEYDPYDGCAEISLTDYDEDEDEDEDEDYDEDYDEDEDSYDNDVVPSSDVYQQSQSIDGVKFNMIHCPAGEGWIGRVEYGSERPRHLVKIAKGFWMGETQVTQELWEKVMGWNPSHFKGSDKLPVECVTWYDCLVFCNKLSKLEKLTPCFTLSNISKDNYGNSITNANVEWNRNANGYRLPTEAEWEYCAKSATELTYSGSDKIDEVAWYHGNSRGKTHKVKKKKPNAWGLYDMSGNVWEWCMDKYDLSAYQSRANGIENPILWENSPCARVVSGGSFWDYTRVCQVAYHRKDGAGVWYPDRGFRLLRCESYDGYAETSLTNYEGERDEDKDEDEDEGSYDNNVMPSSKYVDQQSIDDVKFNMIHCPIGEFWMGSEYGVGYDRERPRHLVKMTKGFWMGETQVTQELWEKVMGWNPSHFKGSDKLPVEVVTWYDCLVFCNKLSESKGFRPCFTLSNIVKYGNQIMKSDVEWNRNANGYRLPTEAEWEYCAKSATELTYSGSDKVDEVAWYGGNSRDKTHKVKKKKPNAWGLYDMIGNVWEWCMDQWDENAYSSKVNGIENPILWKNSRCARVVRGGSYRNYADDCRITYRGVGADLSHHQGFRLLRCEP